MKNFLLIGLMLCLFYPAFSQLAPQKILQTKRSTENIRIDGVFDEQDWQNLAAASNFTQFEPDPGGLPSQQTEVRVLYDDKALYIAATLYDSHPDSIFQQLSQRDNVGVTDYFAFVLDAYKDGQNGLGFIVTASGVQIDIKYSATNNNFSGAGLVFGGDRNWDAVWDSKVRITDKGWMVEMKIPYSALRFPGVEEQIWHVNFSRMIRRHREQLFWNEIKPDEAGMLRQSGELKGIQNIKSPVRLSATPFVAAYAENYFDKEGDPKSSWGRSISGGMDIKYGINDAFTLDMTLIPDFGEAQSDNQVLNLSPFEVGFDENRPFFTEGIELFNKGDIFYSRRVGGQPLKFWDVEDEVGEHEEIISNPQTTQLYNATKLSGRTSGGLGIGLFNAVAARTVAEIQDLETLEKREIETSPLTNYNVTVFDQNLKNNSFVTLINTNVLRSGSTYDANVTGLSFRLNNKGNSYSMNGNAALSQLYSLTG